MPALKRKKVSSLIGELVIDEPPFVFMVGDKSKSFTTLVRYVSHERRDALKRDAIVDGKFDNDLWLEKYADEAIVGFSNLTPVMFDAMVELENDADAPKVNDDDGCIAYSKTIAATLFLGCAWYQDRVFVTASNLLKAEAIRKNSVGSASSVS